VQLLLAKGTDVNAADKEAGWTPLHLAAANWEENLVELLLAKGANVNAVDKHGRTPLGLASEKGYKEIVELLRKHGGHE